MVSQRSNSSVITVQGSTWPPATVALNRLSDTILDVTSYHEVLDGVVSSRAAGVPASGAAEGGGCLGGCDITDMRIATRCKETRQVHATHTRKELSGTPPWHAGTSGTPPCRAGTGCGPPAHLLLTLC